MGLSAIEILERRLKGDAGSIQCLEEELKELEDQIAEKRAAIASNELAVSDLAASIAILRQYGDLK